MKLNHDFRLCASEAKKDPNGKADEGGATEVDEEVSILSFERREGDADDFELWEPLLDVVFSVFKNLWLLNSYFVSKLRAQKIPSNEQSSYILINVYSMSDMRT